MQTACDSTHAAAYMESVCGRPPATNILKLEVTSYLWCLASRRTLVHWTIPWNRSSDHTFRMSLAEENSASCSSLAVCQGETDIVCTHKQDTISNGQKLSG